MDLLDPDHPRGESVGPSCTVPGAEEVHVLTGLAWVTSST